MFEAYRIGIRLSLVNNVSSGLVMLAGQFAALHKDVLGAQGGIKELEARLTSLKRLGLVGGAMAATGAFGLSLLRGPLEEAKQFQTEVAKFSVLGLGEKATTEAVKFAKGMDIIGTSARDNLKLLREATTITGDLHHAMEITPLLAKMRFGMESVMGSEHAGNFDRMFQDAIKVTELRGALVNRQTGQIDMGSFSRVLNMMNQAYIASGGLVKPSDFLAAIKTGGVSAKLMNDESFFFGMGHFMQESGGSRTGTAMMSQFQNWVMGRMSQRVAEDMAKVGLLNPSAVHYGKTGHVTRVDVEGLLRSKEFIDNPFKYMNEVAVPLLQKRGFQGNDLNLKLASLFGIRTASNLADQFVREQKVADLYVSRSRRAGDIDTVYRTGGSTLAGKEIDLHAKWRDVLRELGQSVLPIAIRAVEGLTTVVRGVISFTNEFPRLTRWLVVGFAVLSGIVAAGGVLALATAGFQALGIAMTVGGAAGGGIGMLLQGAALGLRAVSGAAALFMAAYAGWLAGGFLNDHLINPGISKLAGRDESLGTALHGLFHKDPDMSGRPNVVRPGAGGQPVQVQTQVHLDGHQIATVVSKHQATAATRPQTGTRWFDTGMAPPPVNYSY